VSALPIFSAWGIELEYMIVARDSLAVLPVADEVLKAAAGAYVDYEAGPVAWSNELVLHVIELKTNGPTPSLAGWSQRFLADVVRINGILEPLGGMLMPGAMHPTMVPARETRLWPHESSPVYQAYDRIFGCAGHGWSNLQSCHVNLPFSGDEEFGRLHAAIRVLLPILPALAASSPVVEGRVTGLLDNRLDAYRRNQARVPSICGAIVPEPVFTIGEYRQRILGRIYRDIAPLDPEGILQHEFLNSRGAIARFSRDAIEIRLLDVQETPAADLGIALLVGAVLRALVEGRLGDTAAVRAQDTGALAAVLERCIRDGEAAVVEVPTYLTVLGLGRQRATAGEIWTHLAERVLARAPRGCEAPAAAVRTILAGGTLARRLRRALGEAPAAGRIAEVYRELCACLADGRLFVP
jgi:gamma-glutamyl:cysteine ligase YbdK (ATP-grasp superfamily)